VLIFSLLTELAEKRFPRMLLIEDFGPMQLLPVFEGDGVHVV